MREKTFWDGVRDALPTALGYISIGIACGVVAAPYLSLLEMALMSVIVYAGSAQFVMISMFALHQDIASITLTVFLINIRFLLMSLHTSTSFQSASLANNIGIGALLTDESYGVFLGEKVQRDKVSVPWMHGNNLVGYFAWFFATVFGVLLGSLLPDPEMFGLDYALNAMFIGIFAAQFQGMLGDVSMNRLLIVLLAVTVAFLALITVLSSSLAVLFATLVGCTVGVILDDGQ